MRLALVVLLACGQAPAPVQNVTPTHVAPHEVMATIERTACYGTCPIYKVEVYRDGAVAYHGEQFVKVKGDAKGHLDATEIAKLDSLFQRAKYIELKNEYVDYRMTDMPSVITSYKPEGGNEKRVQHYLGDDSPPPALTEVEDGIDKAIRIEQWIGTREEREKLRR